jgi:hypothetical protein
MKKRTWKDVARMVLPWKVYWQLKRSREELRARLSKDDLTSLAKIYKSDKWGFHSYTPIYEKWFAPLRHKPVRLLEIGIGGYDKPLLGGDSLRMWKKYFPKGIITGIDIYAKDSLAEDRIRIYKGDQYDAAFILAVAKREGPFDIIIDDGSHIQSHIIKSFETLFPLMSPGGIYVIEDTQTSYWPKYGGSLPEMYTVNSAMNYFSKMTHHVNRSEWHNEAVKEYGHQFDVASIAFYHNLIFIEKS